MQSDGMQATVREGRWPADLSAARSLLRDYAAHLAQSLHGSVGICIDGFDSELAALPEPYTAKEHAFLVAETGGNLCGCIATHLRATADETVCEVKRLWTAPETRGRGVGRALLAAAIAWAGKHGCTAVVLDTHPVAMPEAGALYRSFGFRQIERFNSNPVPDIVFFRLDLHGSASMQ